MTRPAARTVVRRTGLGHAGPVPATQPPVADSPTDAGGAGTLRPPGTSSRRWRAVAAWSVCALLVLLVPVTAAAVWARGQLLDTDVYLSTIGPVIDEPAVQEALASMAATAVVDAIPLDALVGDGLPDILRPLAAGLVTQVETLVERQALRVIESDVAADVWVTANRVTHAQMVRVLRGDSALVPASGGLVVDLSGVSGAVADRLADRGVPVANDRIPGAQIVLVDAATFERVHGAVRLLDTAATWLPWLLAAAVGALVALRGRRAWLPVAVGLVLGGAVLLTAIAVGRGAYLDQVGQDAVRSAAAAAVFEHLAARLLVVARLVVLVGVAVAVVGWIAWAPGRAARTIRGVAARLRASRGVWGRPVGVGVAALALAVLVLPGRTPPVTAVTLLVLAALGALLAMTSRGRSAGGPAGEVTVGQVTAGQVTAGQVDGA